MGAGPPDRRRRGAPGRAGVVRPGGRAAAGGCAVPAVPRAGPARGGAGGHMSLRYAYNTNGLTSHRLDDALALLADCGYDGVALTLDVAHHDPFAPDLRGRTVALRRRLDGLGLASVVETGARFLLDPRRKHHPTLVSPDAADRARRVAFLQTCVDVAADLGSEAVSFWAGVPGPERVPAWEWLVDGVAQVVDHADEQGGTSAFAPGPGVSRGDLPERGPPPPC